MLTDMHEMVELCLSQCYFLYKNEIRSIPSTGPIGLSLMVVIAEAFFQHLETKALIIAEVGQFSLLGIIAAFFVFLLLLVGAVCLLVILSGRSYNYDYSLRL